MGVIALRNVLRVLCCLSLLSLAACGIWRNPAPASPAATIIQAKGKPGQWVTVFHENFTGPAGSGVNPRIWQYDTGVWQGTGEVETTTTSTSNVHLDGHGNLDITALGHGGSWTSGRIQTKSFGYGAPAGGMVRISASLRQPNAPDGMGYWPAFWLLGPGQWPTTGEVDILEDVDSLSEHSGTFHCGNLTQRNADGTTGPCHEHVGVSSGLLPCNGCQTGYDTYTVIIDRTNAADGQIRWYLDGKQYFAVNESQVGQSAWTKAVDHGFSIVFDLAIGGGYPQEACQCQPLDGPISSGGTVSIHDVTVSVLTGRA